MDGGSSWGEMVYDSAVPDPDCQGAVLGLPNGSLVFSNANSPSKRQNPSLRLGQVVMAQQRPKVEWSATTTQLATTTTAAGYSSVFQMPSGQLGVLWETEGGQPARGCRGEGCSIVLSLA